jgi:hypothetical protein
MNKKLMLDWKNYKLIQKKLLLIQKKVIDT